MASPLGNVNVFIQPLHQSAYTIIHFYSTIVTCSPLGNQSHRLLFSVAALDPSVTSKDWVQMSFTVKRRTKRRRKGLLVRPSGVRRSVIVYSLLSTSTNGIFNDEKGSPSWLTESSLTFKWCWAGWRGTVALFPFPQTVSVLQLNQQTKNTVRGCLVPGSYK